MFRTFITLLVTSAAIAAWLLYNGRTESYAIPVSTATERLAALTLEESILVAGEFRRSQILTEQGTNIRWSFGLRKEASSCIVRLQDDGYNNTRADLDCEIKERPELGRVTSLLSHILLKMVMTEHLKSALSGREFDKEGMNQKIFAFGMVAGPATMFELHGERIRSINGN